jgi:hypothetical protein
MREYLQEFYCVSNKLENVLSPIVALSLCVWIPCVTDEEQVALLTIRKIIHISSVVVLPRCCKKEAGFVIPRPWENVPRMITVM